MIILWYSVVFKNKNTSYFNNLLVEAGGVEPPLPIYFLSNSNELYCPVSKPRGSSWLQFLKSSEYAHNDRLIKFLVFIRLKRFLRLKTMNRRT
jgi:hypothetical protein